MHRGRATQKSKWPRHASRSSPPEQLNSQLTVGDGGTDAGEDEEQGGDELGHVGLDGGGAEGVADAPERELHHLRFRFRYSLHAPEA